MLEEWEIVAPSLHLSLANWNHDKSYLLTVLNSLVFTIWNYVNIHTLWELFCIYIAIFDKNINYANLLLDQNLSALGRIFILQKKYFKLMNFQPTKGLPFQSSAESNPTTFFEIWRSNSHNHTVSYSASIFKVIRQSGLLLGRPLNRDTQLILMEKTQSL